MKTLQRTAGVVALPFYYTEHPERGAVTRKVFEHYRRIADQLGLAVVGVGSEGETSRSMWGDYFDPDGYVEYDQPGPPGPGGAPWLRLKFDHTVRLAEQFDPDRVFIGGSDDLLPLEYFEQAFASDADLIGLGGPVRIVIDGVILEWDGRYDWSPQTQCAGGGLTLSRRLLDAWHWAPFQGDSDEIGIESRARDQGFTVDALDLGYWSVKTEGAALNGWVEILRLELTPGQHLQPEFDALWGAL